MSNEAFDKALTKLYQQRKAQTVAPKIKIDQLKNREIKKLPIMRAFGLLFTAGGASFAIFAIITHLAKPPVDVKSVAYTSQPIVVEKLPTEQVNVPESETYEVALAPLPPQKKSAVKSTNFAVAAKTETLEQPTVDMPVNYVQGIAVPPLKQPELSLEPIFRVMPKYLIDKNKRNQLGEVKLSYQINNRGETTSITIVSSNVDRELKKSARKALAQWRYKTGIHYNGIYEIIFEFTQ